MQKLPERREFLEVGCFEGRASCWLLQNGLDPSGTLVCIDTFQGSEEHLGLDLGSLRETFDQNVHEAQRSGQTIETIAAESHRGLADLIKQDRKFDFIYIDASHTAPDVMTDACMAFKLLKKGGDRSRFFRDAIQ